MHFFSFFFTLSDGSEASILHAKEQLHLLLRRNAWKTRTMV